MSLAPPAEAPVDRQDDAPRTEQRGALISRVPYMPGLDGMRAIAVVAVMIYHANSSWLPGGFLGVEMFFVISGYLITLLIIAERERTYRVSLKDFWLRRARRLLPALYVMMAAVVVGTALIEPDALGLLRGDVVAGLLYVSNWYQIIVGLGYTAAADFAPLRHLWSLAVEEQFYIIWPLVMVLFLRRYGTRRISVAARWLIGAAITITVLGMFVYPTGPIGDPSVTPDAYWWIGDRPISKLDTLYIGTISRSTGLLLGAAMAMLWRPYAVVRGPLRRKGHLFDVFAAIALVVFIWLNWNVHLVTPEGRADGFLFKGGLFVCALVTLTMIAAVSHRGAAANRILGNRLFLWIGTRSYGLYLYHWPIYQFIRKTAGSRLSLPEFVFAMLLTAAVTELSYRLVETPIRQGRLKVVWRRAREGSRRRVRGTVAVGATLFAAVVVFLGATLVTADLKQNEVTEDLTANEQFVTDLAAGGVVGSAEQTGLDPGTDDSSGSSNGTTSDEESAESLDDARSASDLDRSDEDDSGSATDTETDGEPASGSDSEPGDDGRTDAATTLPADADPAAEPASDPDVATTVPDPAPSTTAAPAPEAPLPETPPRPVQIGVVNDLSTLEPLAVPRTVGGIPFIALGDSVMLGAAEELQAEGFAVDAVVSRQMVNFLPDMQMIRDNGTFGSAVVVHLGTNGPFSQQTLDQMMALLADVPVVLALTGKADRGWIAGNNERIRALPAAHPNVTVLDWEVLSADCPGRCFYDDGIHLTPEGQAYYTSLVTRTLGLT